MMKKQFSNSILIALVILGCVYAGASTLTTYTSPTTFNSATSGLNNVTVTFEGLDSYPGLSTCIPDSTGASCITIKTYDTNNNLQTIFVSNPSDPWNWGTGNMGVCTKMGYCIMYPNSPDFSLDMMSVAPNGPQSFPVTVTTADGTTQTFMLSGGTYPNPNFWGVTTDGDFITSIKFDTRNVNDFPAYDNITYDPPDIPTGVPEPASLVLFGTGVMSLAAFVRRFRNR
jgi:hypothetical protein